QRLVRRTSSYSLVHAQEPNTRHRRAREHNLRTSLRHAGTYFQAAHLHHQWNLAYHDELSGGSMTTIPFQTYPFAPTKPNASPAPIARDMPTRLADIINVKDYGATGDGHTDDSFALQAAIAAAYGTFGSPHGDRTPGPYGNKIVYFPPGHYIIGTTLQ